MAFDGVTISALVKELNDTLTGGRIYKIAQPETDALLLTIKVNGTQKRLLMSADASLPLLYLTDHNLPSPMTAPGFCMLLRKHLQNARIIGFTQPGLERAVHMELEHLNEMGDLCKKQLVIELMGKHSNIIFINNEQVILDSIKHISGAVSSVREVLPGRTYFLPDTQSKEDLLTADAMSFTAHMTDYNGPVYKGIYCTYTGVSPFLAEELCARADIDSSLPGNAYENNTGLTALWKSIQDLQSAIHTGSYAPAIIYENGIPREYSVIPVTMYPSAEQKSFDSVSALLESYYAEKNEVTRIRQKSADLRKIVQTALERTVKKYDLQLAQMKDTEKKDKYRIWGELITAYGYNVPEGSKSMEALNYYDNQQITIPLDPTITPMENAKKYFDKYAKLKRTYEALSKLTVEVKDEIDHLESIATSLDIAKQEEDLLEIKEELIESGYIKRKGGSKKVKFTSKPFHYLSSDGFHIYVGKNNYQNDELTFKFANGGDWWFHAKGIPGSHVVLKTEGNEVPDRAFEEAAALAAFYSKGKQQDKVEIDYLQRKNVKKPAGAKPGFVVYYTNYSMMIGTDISGLIQV